MEGWRHVGGQVAVGEQSGDLVGPSGHGTATFAARPLFFGAAPELAVAACPLQQATGV
jgi:hypothetical protein